MELHHLRRFVILAEELHFTRAAERLHIEQSPLSRNIKELEEELGVLLFDRDHQGTRLNPAGTAFLQDVRRLFKLLEQAQENVKAVAAGLRGTLHIAISDHAVDPRLSVFLACCRAEEPELEVHLSEVTLSEQWRGLRCGDFLFRLAHIAEVGTDIIAEPVWQDPIVVAMPSRHPLLAHKTIPLRELANYPLVMGSPQIDEGYDRALFRFLHTLEQELHIIEQVTSQDMMLTLVGAGYGIGLTTAPRFSICRRSDVLTRPLGASSSVISTYLLQIKDNDNATMLLPKLMERLRRCADG